MNAELLRNSVEALVILRAELRGSVEDSVLEKLDKVISDLESIQQHPDKISASDVLNVLGQVLETLPAIVEMIHILTIVLSRQKTLKLEPWRRATGVAPGGADGVKPLIGKAP